MKILLMYNYNLKNPTIYRVNNQIHIKDGKKRYKLSEVTSENEVVETNFLIEKYIQGNNYHKIVKNNKNEFTLSYKGKKYVLIETNQNRENLNKLLTVPVKIQLLESNKYGLDRSNWYFLWCQKNDYIEYYFNHIKGKYKLLDESINYYLGLAENAITYLNTTDKNNKNIYLYLSHKRIEPQEIHNPLNIIIDNRERDISEYIKYMFFYNKSEFKIEKILERIFNEKLYAEKIYARLIYPTYFFDLYEKIDKGEKTEKDLRIIIEQIDNYELFLKEIYKKITSKMSIKKIDWL